MSKDILRLNKKVQILPEHGVEPAFEASIETMTEMDILWNLFEGHNFCAGRLAGSCGLCRNFLCLF